MNQQQRAVVQQALEALEKARSRITVAGGSGWKLEAQRCINAITALRQLLEQPEPVQEPVACAVCNEIHAILDADESKIIRDAKDGYPDGRRPRTLTLQERITALCVYASDWKRWCLEKENTTPPAQPAVPLTDEQIDDIWNRYCDEMGEASINDAYDIARAIEAAHGITAAPEKGETE